MVQQQLSINRHISDSPSSVVEKKSAGKPLLWEDIVTVCVFATILLLFSVGTAFQLRLTKLCLEENRFANSFPSLSANYESISCFPRGFEKFFNDRVCWRTGIIALRNLLRLELFAIPGNSHVLIGKNGFFFDGSSDNLNLMRRARPFSQNDLIVWKSILEKRTAWCKARGIDYIYILVPTKESVYPELLPNDLQNFAGPTRAEQLMDFLHQTHSPVKAIYLKDAVRAGKQILPLYLKTDTHWNQLGAYYGYCALIEYLRATHPSLQEPLALSQFPIADYVFSKGDLARLQGLFGILKETNIGIGRCLIPKKSIVIRYPFNCENRQWTDETRPFRVVLPDSKLPKALMIRDSFASPWAELFLRDHFSTISFFWQLDFNKEIVEQTKPEIVMQEELELWLYQNDVPSE